MFRTAFLSAIAAIALAAPVAADDTDANRLLRQAHDRWVAAQAMAPDDPARAELLALAHRDLQTIVRAHPDSTVATLLALGESIGPLSLAAVDAAVAAAPAVDVLCEGPACTLDRLDAVIARAGPDPELAKWRSILLAELGHTDEGLAAAPEWGQPTDKWGWVAVVRRSPGARLTQRRRWRRSAAPRT